MIRSVIDHDVVDMFFQNSTAFDFYKDKESLIKHMASLKTQSVEESTLYKKWIELRRLDNTKEVVSTGALMGRLWTPTDIFDRERTIEEIERVLRCEYKREPSQAGLPNKLRNVPLWTLVPATNPWQSEDRRSISRSGYHPTPEAPD